MGRYPSQWGWLAQGPAMLSRRVLRALASPADVASAGSFRAFGAAPPSDTPSQSSSSTPSRTAASPRRPPARATKREYIWPPEDLPQWRRTLMKVISQWGGLIWFGSFMGVAWLAKKYNESAMDELDRELSKPRR